MSWTLTLLLIRQSQSPDNPYISVSIMHKLQNTCSSYFSLTSVCSLGTMVDVWCMFCCTEACGSGKKSVLACMLQHRTGRSRTSGIFWHTTLTYYGLGHIKWYCTVGTGMQGSFRGIIRRKVYTQNFQWAFVYTKVLTYWQRKGWILCGVTCV